MNDGLHFDEFSKPTCGQELRTSQVVTSTIHTPRNLLDPEYEEEFTDRVKTTQRIMG